MSTFAVITAAHNEEAYLESTIRSMRAQTVRPVRWVIVNDGSSDRTGEIASVQAREAGFIRVVNVARASGRNFGKKVLAFNRGLAELRGIEFAFLGNLDADIELAPQYFENVLREFARDPGLGIAGGQVYTRIGDQFCTHDKTLDSVGGAVQLFRRECFEAVGGLRPLEYGGEDGLVEIMARMRGWRVRKFPENRVLEHRRTGSGEGSPLAAKFREGRRFYGLGYGLVFYTARCLYRVLDRPLILGSVAAWAGFLGSVVARHPTALPPEAADYLRAEQRAKLMRTLRLPEWRKRAWSGTRSM